MPTTWTLCAAAAIVLGILARQLDRLWFTPYRGHRLRFRTAVPKHDVREILQLQRQRLNRFTPAVLAAGHWLEILGWIAICRIVPLYVLPLLCVVVAVKFRHLQELTHAAVHGCLAPGRRYNDVLGEVIFQAPLAMPSLSRRRQSHVVEHHPNATDPDLDPNIAQLHAAGMRPGCSRGRFLRALMYPSTLAGLGGAARNLIADARCPRATRYASWLPLVVVMLVTAVGWVPGLVVVLVSRVIVYPYLAWLSLLVEHRWFAAPRKRRTRQELEAVRCLRLYRTRWGFEWLARVTWLPYGDLFHYAHSVYPSVRWNYLQLVDHILGDPRSTFSAALWGRSSVAAAHFRDSRVAGESSATDNSRTPVPRPVLAGRPQAGK